MCNSVVKLLLRHYTSGQIPSVKIGRSVRVPTEALRRWIKERESGGLNNNKEDS